jgi:uncharacterized membrane protein YhaH (DUF805 family)
MEKLEKDYNMIDWFKKVVFRNYANFEGRARRAEYWYFYLCAMLLFIPPYLLFIVGAFQESMPLMIVSGVVLAIIGFSLLLPTLAVFVRRMHDTGKSGWYFMLNFIPFVSLVAFIFTLLESDKFTNKYGKDPKNPDQDDELNKIGTE